MAKQGYATSSLVIGYALCSSLLAIINKYAITKFSYPGLLTALQYLTSVVGVWVLGKLGLLYHDPFNFQTAKKFAPAAVVFYLAIFTNTHLLKHANVDTFIVFRSLTPLLVAIADTTFRKQPCPSKLTFMSLIIILGGAVGYVMTDSAFTLTAYSWALAYLITITTEMVYIKHMGSTCRYSEPLNQEGRAGLSLMPLWLFHCPVCLVCSSASLVSLQGRRYLPRRSQ